MKKFLRVITLMFVCVFTVGTIALTSACKEKVRYDKNDQAVRAWHIEIDNTQEGIDAGYYNLYIYMEVKYNPDSDGDKSFTVKDEQTGKTKKMMAVGYDVYLAAQWYDIEEKKELGVASYVEGTNYNSEPVLYTKYPGIELKENQYYLKFKKDLWPSDFVNPPFFSSKDHGYYFDFIFERIKLVGTDETDENIKFEFETIDMTREQFWAIDCMPEDPSLPQMNWPFRK